MDPSPPTASGSGWRRPADTDARDPSLEGARQTAWLIPVEPSAAARAHRRRWTWIVVLLLLGLPFAGFLAYRSIQFWAGAASDCQMFEAGGRLFALVVVLPALSIALWLVYAVPLAIIGRWSIAVGLILGVALALAGAYWFVSGTGEMIRADSDGSYFCPTGVPEWWPTWLPE